MQAQHPIDKLFQQNLAELGVEPASGLWDRIEQSLDAPRKPKVIIPGRFWLMAASFLLVAGLGTGLFYLTYKTDDLKDGLAVRRQADTPPKHEVKQSVAPDRSSPAPIQMRPSTMQAEVVTDHQTTMPTEQTNIQPIALQPADRSNTALNNIAQASNSDMARLDPKGVGYATPGSRRLHHNTAIFVGNTSNDISYTTSRFEEPKARPASTAPTRWMLGAMVSPTHSYRTLNGSSDSHPRTNESGLSSLNGGLTVKMTRGLRWALESGIVYARTGQTISNPGATTLNSPLRTTSDFAMAAQNETTIQQNSLGRISPKNQTPQASSDGNFIMTSALATGKQETSSADASGEIRQMLDYIEIPVSARYYVSKKKQGAVSISAGLSANFLVGNNAVQIANGSNTHIGKTENINDISYSSHIGIGIDVPLLSGFTVSIEPIFKYFITPVNHSSAYNFRPYSMGMNSGVTYRF